MPAHRTTTPHGRIEALMKGIRAEAKNIGLEGFSVSWETRSDEHVDPNVSESGALIFSFGNSGTNTREIGVSQLKDDGRGRNHLVVGSKVVPLGLKVIGSDPDARSQNTFVSAITSPNSPFYGQHTSLNAAASGVAISGESFIASALVGAAKMSKDKKRDLTSADFHKEFESLVGFLGGYTGQGPAEGGANYTPPQYYVVGSSAHNVRSNTDRTQLPGGPFFNTGFVNSPNRYTAGSYMTEQDYADYSGMQRSPDGIFTFIGKNIGKVTSAFQRMSRERYTQDGNDTDVSKIPLAGDSFQRGFSSGRTILVALTNDASKGGGEGRLIASTNLMEAPSRARPGQFREYIPEVATIGPNSLSLDTSERRSGMAQTNMLGRAIAFMKGGQYQTLATFSDGKDEVGSIGIPKSGYRGRETGLAPRMWVGTQQSSIKQFLDPIFGEHSEVMQGGAPLIRSVAENALTNDLQRFSGETDEEYGNRYDLRQSTLKRLRSAWTDTTNQWGGDWAKVGVGFQGEEDDINPDGTRINRAAPRGGQGFHATEFIWGQTAIIPSMATKSQFIKGVGAHDPDISPTLAPNSILATPADISKGPGWLDARHSFWYATSDKYRKAFDRSHMTVGQVEKRVEAYERDFNAKLKQSNPEYYQNASFYHPTIQAHAAAEYNASARVTLADIIRGQQDKSMTPEMQEYYMSKFRDTPVFGVLRGLSTLTPADKLSKEFLPIGKSDIPMILPKRRLGQIGAHLQAEYGWDPSTKNNIEVNGLTIPSPSQVQMMGDNRQFMRAYEGLFSNADIDERRVMLDKAKAHMLEQVTSENSRSEFSKSSVEAGYYTQYSADPHLIGQNAISVGPWQVQEMYERAGGKRENFTSILDKMRTAKPGDIIGQVDVGREPAQVSLQRMNLKYDPTMPMNAVPNISPEFELLTLGDSDGDPMKVFLIPERLHQKIDPNHLARRAFGTMAAMAGVDKTVEYLSDPQNQRSVNESERDYLYRITMGKNALVPMIGQKAQNVAVDRMKTGKAELEHIEATSADIQEQITDLNENRGGNAPIYNLVQSLRTALPRSLINQAFQNSKRMQMIAGVTGESASTYMGTALGAWYQYPLDAQKLPNSMKHLNEMFNFNALESMRGGKTIKGLTLAAYGKMRDEIELDKEGNFTKYAHSPEEVGVLYGSGAKDIARLTDEVAAYRASGGKNKAPELSGGKSAVSRTLAASIAIQFEQKKLDGEVRWNEKEKYWEQSEPTRVEKDGEMVLNWSRVNQETLNTVDHVLKKDRALYESMRTIRKRQGTAEQFYSAIPRLGKLFKQIFGDIALPKDAEERINPAHPESVALPKQATDAEVEAAIITEEKAQKSSLDMTKLSLKPGNKERIDKLGNVGGRVLAIDSETVFDRRIGKDGKPIDDQAVFDLGFSSKEDGEKNTYHPVGKFIKDHWEKAGKVELENMKEMETLVQSSKIRTTGQEEYVRGMGENKSKEEYAQALANLKDGDLLVGHNITGSDHKWLGSPETKAKIQDTMHIANMLSGQNNYALRLGDALGRYAQEDGGKGEIADYLANEYGTGQHTAAVDAKGARLLYARQIMEAAALPESTLESFASSDEWKASDNPNVHEDDAGYGERMNLFFKNALEHKRKGGIKDGTAEQQKTTTEGIFNSFRHGSFHPVTKAVPGRSGSKGGGGKGSGGDGGGGTVEGPNENDDRAERSGRGFSGMSDVQFEKLLSGVSRISSQIGKAINLGAGRVSANYKPGASEARNKAILDTFGDGGGFSSDSDPARSALETETGTGIGRIDDLFRESANLSTSPSRQLQIARGIRSHGIRVLESSYHDGRGSPTPEAIKAATLLRDRGQEIQQLGEQKGPAYEARVRLQALEKAKRDESNRAIRAAAVEELKNDPKNADFLKKFEAALEDVTKRVKEFGKAVDEAKPGAEGKSSIKGRKALVADAIKRAEAVAEDAPSAAIKDALKKSIDVTGDLTGGREGSLITPEQSKEAAAISAEVSEGKGSTRKGVNLLQKLMGGFMIFSLARDWRMMFAPQIQGAETVMADRSATVGAMSQSGLTSIGAMYGKGARQMQYWADTRQGFDEAGYNMVSGLAQIAGGRPDELSRDPRIGAASASIRAGLGVGAAFAFAGLPHVGLVAGAAAGILGAGAYLQGYGSDTVARASDIYNNRDLLQGTGSREQVALADSVRKQQGLSLQDYKSNTYRAAIYDSTSGVRPVQASNIPYYSGSQLRNPGQAILANATRGIGDAFTDAFGIIGDVSSKVKSAFDQDEKYLPIGQTPEQWRRYIRGEMTEEEREKIYTESGGITGAAAARAVQMRNWTDTKDSTFGDIWKESGVSNEVRLGIVSSLVSGQFNMTPSGSTRAKQIAAQLASGLPPDQVMSTAEGLGAAWGTGSAFPATLEAWGGSAFADQKQSLTNWQRLGGAQTAAAYRSAGMDIKSAESLVRNLASANSVDSAEPGLYGGARISDDQMTGFNQGMALMQQAPFAGLNLQSLPQQMRQSGSMTGIQMSTASALLSGNPVMLAAMANMGGYLPGMDFDSATTVDYRNGGSALFQYSPAGISAAYDRGQNWQKNKMGFVVPSGKSRGGFGPQQLINSTRSALEKSNPMFANLDAMGARPSDEVMARFSGADNYGLAGMAGVKSYYARQGYELSMGSVGVSMQQAQLSRNFELNVTQPQRDLQLQMQGISLFGGSLQTPYAVTPDNPTGTYSAKGSFYWQQQELNFARQTSAIQFGRAIQGNQWEQQSSQLNRQGQLASRSVGRYDLGYQQRDLQLGHQYFAEDWGLNQQKRQLSFGWQQEDYGRNIRRATGFDKQQMIREQGRSVEMFQLDTKQFEREKTREETKYRREQERWDVQKEQFETMAALEDARFAIEQEQINKKKSWAQEDFQRENEARGRQQKQLEEAKEAALLQYNMEKDQWNKQKEFSAEQFKLQMQALGIQAAQIANQEKLRLLDEVMQAKAEANMRRQAKHFQDLMVAVLRGIAQRLGIPLPEFDSGPATTEEDKPTEALGGHPRKGSTKIVGEYGPELVTFGADATVHPTHKTITQVMGPGKYQKDFQSETPVQIVIDGKVIAEAAIKHGGPAMRRSQRSTFGV